MAPNANAPIGSVGPNVPVQGDASAQGGAEGGQGATEIMHVPPWAGYPVGWETPFWNTPVPGAIRHMSDVAFACIALNARVIGRQPVTANRRGAPAALPSWSLNPQPEVYTGWPEFIKQVVWSYQATGEAFIFCTSRDAYYRPRSFVLLNSWAVSVELRDGIREYRDARGMPFDPDDILHIRDNSQPDDPHGHSALEAAGDRMVAAEVLSRYASNLARNGGIPWAVLQTKYRLTDEQAEAIKLKWITSARNRLGAPAILDSDMTLRELQVAPKDMALSEMQQYNDARICVLLGVPPVMMAVDPGTTSMTYSNVNMMFDFHHRAELDPLGNELMVPISQWALPRGTSVELNFDRYTRPDPESRARTYQMLHGISDEGGRAITVEEIRRMERLAIRADAADGVEQTDAAAALTGAEL